MNWGPTLIIKLLASLTLLCVFEMIDSNGLHKQVLIVNLIKYLIFHIETE